MKVVGGFHKIILWEARFSKVIKIKHYKVLTFSLHVFRVGIICQSRVGNPFHATGLLPLENVRKPEVFWYFQGVQKETSGMKWVNFERIQNI